MVDLRPRAMGAGAGVEAEEAVMHGWQRDGFESHVGAVGVLLADGSEPGPVFYDLGSGGSVHQSTDWRSYDGEFGHPRAVSMRGRCACGWRGSPVYPIDWAEVGELGDPDAYDVSGPYGDWAAHLDEVSARVVVLPEELVVALKRVREEMDRLFLGEGAYVRVLRTCGELEAIVVAAGPEAVRFLASGEDGEVPRVAEALGMTEEAARVRLARYERLDY
ncbi:hypothetical protein [Streptomyces sp. NPDC094049]|uniref:hypothetical protein n=1 Tax=Streptomyces sp. NPDC094049 TaxID=3154987 RepID=UPI0033193E5C